MMKGYRVYFNDGNQKLYQANDLGHLVDYLRKWTARSYHPYVFDDIYKIERVEDEDTDKYKDHLGHILSIIKEVQVENGDPDDGFAEEIMERIVDDNGTDLTDDQVRELAAQFYDEDPEEVDTI